MPASLLGLLLLACPHHCELPLPGSVLELRVEAAQWQWCLRGTTARWRLCEEDWPRAIPAPLQRVLQGAQGLLVPSTSIAPRKPDGADGYIS